MNALRHDDFNVVRESINREISAVDSEDLLDSRIGVDRGEDDRVDIRKRLIRVLGQYLSGPLVSSVIRLPHLKQLRRVVDQPEDR